MSAEGLEFSMGGPWLGECSDTRVVWEGLGVGGWLGAAEVQDDGRLRVPCWMS